jgi:hypothetical protein
VESSSLVLAVDVFVCGDGKLLRQAEVVYTIVPAYQLQYSLGDNVEHARSQTKCLIPPTRVHHVVDLVCRRALVVDEHHVLVVAVQFERYEVS